MAAPKKKSCVDEEEVVDEVAILLLLTFIFVDVVGVVKPSTEEPCRSASMLTTANATAKNVFIIDLLVFVIIIIIIIVVNSVVLF